MSNAQQEERERARKQEATRARFCEVITRKYHNECKRLGTEPTAEGLVQYILANDLVPTVDVHRYMAIELYPKALYHTNGSKTHAIQYLEDELAISDRTIWNWVGRMGGRFKRGRRRGSGGKRRGA